jgi:uncharacterized cupredoxin-like copper-binding protein
MLRRTAIVLACAVLAAPAAARGFQDAPRILLDQPERAVEYQLGRLTNDELVLVERSDTDAKYRPVHLAILIRKGMAQQFRDGALAALTKLDKAGRGKVLLAALSRVPADDPATADRLIALLLAQPAAALKADRAAFATALESATEPHVLRGGYAALMLADGTPDAAWQLASKRDGHLVELLRAVPLIPAGGDGGKLRDALFTPVAALVKDDDRTRAAAALGALGYTRPDAATFGVIAQGLTAAADIGAYASAIRSLRAIPEAAWPADAIAPLARALASKVASLPPEARTEADTLDVVQFAERLSAKLPGDTGTALRRDLRALGVQVVRIQAIPEKLTFDLRWFAVEAGKPVQIVLVNPDAMPHNLVVGRPGSLEEIGTAGGAMPMPTDPAVKPFVPASPQVLFATNLVKEGDTERLAVTAPKVPGEYIFVCTFPGHWVRMYGVMLVVESLEAWEAKPTTPIDPVTKQPFTSQRN